MAAAFLLRFQEFCEANYSLDVRSGTKTETKVFGEQGDNDPGIVSFATLPHTPSSAGTMTKTSIDRETGGQDQDRKEASLRVVPRHRSTSQSATKTKIKGEQADRSMSEIGTLFLPMSSCLAVANTKTVTAVKAEVDDNDPSRSSLQAIPTCS